jgi:hypothetical protein
VGGRAVKREGEEGDDTEEDEEEGGVLNVPRRTRTGRQLRAPAWLRDDLGHEDDVVGGGRGQGVSVRDRRKDSHGGDEGSEDNHSKAKEQEPPAAKTGANSKKGRRKAAAAVTQESPGEAEQSSALEVEEVQYIGVRPMKPGGVRIFRASQYLPTVRHGKRTINWGSFATAKEAAVARDLIAVGLYGTQGLNFPVETYTLEQVRGQYVDLMDSRPKGFFPQGFLRTGLRQSLVAGVPPKRAVTAAAAAGGGATGGGGDHGQEFRAAAGGGGEVKVTLGEMVRVKVVLKVVRAAAAVGGGGGGVGQGESGQQQQQEEVVEMQTAVLQQQQGERASQHSEGQQGQGELGAPPLCVSEVRSMDVDQVPITGLGQCGSPGDAAGGDSSADVEMYEVRLELSYEPAVAVGLQLGIGHQQQQQQLQGVGAEQAVDQHLPDTAAVVADTAAAAVRGIAPQQQQQISPKKRKVGLVVFSCGVRLGVGPRWLGGRG